jgi:hypothetical protein
MRYFGANATRHFLRAALSRRVTPGAEIASKQAIPTCLSFTRNWQGLRQLRLYFRGSNHMISISPALKKCASKAYPSVLPIVSILLSIYVYSSTLDATLEGNLRNHMLAYTDKFEKVLETIDDPFTVEGYGKLPKAKKAQVQIVAGLLAGVVDLMNEAKDPRADRWAPYLAGIPGPLAEDYPLEAWVRDQKTIDQIGTARRQVKADLKPKS